MIQNLTKKRNDEGFTLIELLVVVVILGILAAVVVFAVGGITDKGQTSACKTDAKTLRTAQEANFAKNNKYDTEDNLKTNGFLAEASVMHDFTSITAADPTATPPVPASYKVVIANTDDGKKCGTPGTEV